MDAYLLLTPDLLVLAATDGYLTATGARREDLVGRTLSRVVPTNPTQHLVPLKDDRGDVQFFVYRLGPKDLLQGRVAMLAVHLTRRAEELEHASRQVKEAHQAIEERVFARLGTVSTRRDEPKVVLVVDDDELVRRVIGAVLEEEGFEVVAFHGGLDALSWLDADPRRRLHLVLTDLTMPDMDGLAFGRHLERERPDVPVLFMSGWDEPARGALDGRELLRKPFRPEALIARVRALLQPPRLPIDDDDLEASDFP
jgi:CheY-like chemotaxis protein